MEAGTLVTRVAVLRAPGTNCDRETARALREAGGIVEVVRVSDLEAGIVDLSRFAGVVLPGGFSYADRVRAGAVLAAKLRTSLRDTIEEMRSRGRPVLGICNGFQVLVELGVLPGIDGCRAALAPNSSARFEFRWIHVRRVGRCRLSAGPDVQPMPVAHGEGKVVFSDPRCVEELESAGLVAYKYSMPDGTPVGGTYPYNPNGSEADIAGLCSPDGDVLGLMPHPERAIYDWQVPPALGSASGISIFRAFVEVASSSMRHLVALD
ncbi:MAG: phosphoribosylformylglycinamidine synthase I [Conexivisphaera sp.]